MNLIRKFSSRKFWITVIGTVTGIAELLGANGNVVGIISGALLALVPTVVYVFTEGKIDEAAAGNEKE